MIPGKTVCVVARRQRAARIRLTDPDIVLH